MRHSRLWAGHLEPIKERWQIHTAFITNKGLYCYKVMPFGPGATYQRAMTVIFDDLLHRVVECYVDDLVVKTKRRPSR